MPETGVQVVRGSLARSGTAGALSAALSVALTVALTMALCAVGGVARAQGAVPAPPVVPAPAAPDAGSPANRTVVVTPGMSVQGRLSSSDPKLDRGRSYDTYRFEAEAGRQYRVLASSPDFDTVLFVLGEASGTDLKVWSSDDMADGTTDSEIIYTAAASGIYEILVTSFGSGESGRYRLALTWTDGGMRNTESGSEDPRQGTGRRRDAGQPAPFRVMPARY